MDINKKRILINDHSGHPFQVQLSRELARRGHEVLHTYSSSFQTPKGPLNKRSYDSDSFQIKGIQLSRPFQKYSYIKRRFQEKEYGHLLSEEIMTFKPDILISSNTPLDAQSVIINTLHSENVRFVFWVQDIYSMAIQNIFTKKFYFCGSLIAKYYGRMERKQLRASDAIVLITEDFMSLMKAWNIEEKKCHVIPNWAPIDELPICLKENNWSVKNNLHDKLCIMYSGTLGMKHNPEILLMIAQQYRNDDNIIVVIISEGLGADWLKIRKAQLNLVNLIILDFQPFEELPFVLSSADIFLAILESNAGVFSVPSKVLTYLCFRRPLLLAVPEENLSAKIVQQNNAGFVVNPDKFDLIIEKLDELIRNPGLGTDMGNNGFQYAQKYFDINVISDSFEKIIYEIS